jgi:hypothetical protein
MDPVFKTKKLGPSLVQQTAVGFAIQIPKYRNQILSGDFAGTYRSHSLNATGPKCNSGSLECTPPEALGDGGPEPPLSPVKCRIFGAFRNDALTHHREKGWIVLEWFVRRKP